MVQLTVNNRKITAQEGMTILEAAIQNHIHVPHFCFLKDVHRSGTCRICVVEVDGAKTLQASCMVEVKEGMIVHTNTERVRKARKILYELILSDHPKDCLNCTRNRNCELQELGEQLNTDECRFEGERSRTIQDFASPAITRDMSKCVLCRRCVTICNEVQGIGVINAQNRGFKTHVGPADNLPINSVNCVFCGQCTTVCPVGALAESDSIQKVWAALHDKNKKVIIQTAPAVRAALGEEFGFEPGTLVTGKMVTVLRNIGFDKVFDTNYAADLTIIEEGHELLERIKSLFAGESSVLPMITSCSPGWIKFIEHTFPDETDHLSTCKSPHMMLGALIKSYYAKKISTDPQNIFVVSVMPCTAKKFEISRPEMMNNGCANVDAVLTTRELARMIKESGEDFAASEEGQFDNPLGQSTGAADIFGTTGGVMEAAIRTVHELITGREVPFDGLHIKSLMGLERIKTAEIMIQNPLKEFSFLDGVTINVAVTSGLKGARVLMEQVAKGESPYHFIEIMGCPGGCISGGGQPRPTNDYIRQKRIGALYKEDENKEQRKSHNNPFIQKLYEEFLIEPLGHLSHELLHTSYTKRNKFRSEL